MHQKVVAQRPFCNFPNLTISKSQNLKISKSQKQRRVANLSPIFFKVFCFPPPFFVFLVFLREQNSKNEQMSKSIQPCSPQVIHQQRRHIAENDRSNKFSSKDSKLQLPETRCRPSNWRRCRADRLHAGQVRGRLRCWASRVRGRSRPGRSGEHDHRNGQQGRRGCCS